MGLDAQLAALEHELAQIAEREPWSDPIRWLTSFRGIALRTALGLLAEIGDVRRFGSPRELMSYLGLTVSEHVPADVTARAWHAQIRLHHRHRHLTSHGKRSTVATAAVARELTGFIWAAMTQQPLREETAAA